MHSHTSHQDISVPASPKRSAAGEAAEERQRTSARNRGKKVTFNAQVCIVKIPKLNCFDFELMELLFFQDEELIEFRKDYLLELRGLARPKSTMSMRSSLSSMRGSIVRSGEGRAAGGCCQCLGVQRKERVSSVPTRAQAPSGARIDEESRKPRANNRLARKQTTHSEEEYREDYTEDRRASRLTRMHAANRQSSGASSYSEDEVELVKIDTSTDNVLVPE